jgi:hypothetical protein
MNQLWRARTESRLERCIRLHSNVAAREEGAKGGEHGKRMPGAPPPLMHDASSL